MCEIFILRNNLNPNLFPLRLNFSIPLYFFLLLSFRDVKNIANESNRLTDKLFEEINKESIRVKDSSTFLINIRKFSKFFLNLNTCTEQVAKKFGITHLLLGGSTVYKHFEKKTKINQMRDIDLVLLVKNKDDMFRLVHEKCLLNTMLKIVKSEVYEIDIPKNIEKEIDAIRFTGFQANGTKIGVKVLSLEYLYAATSQSRPSRLNLLSCKDCHHSGNLNFYSTQISKDFFILHEADIFESLSSDNRIFGITIDLFMTAVPILEFTSSLRLLKKKMLQKIPKPVFARTDSFHSSYRQWLTSYLAVPDTFLSHKEYKNEYFVYIPKSENPSFYPRPYHMKQKLSVCKHEMLESVCKNPFSSNCRYGIYREFFWKMPKNATTVDHEELISKKLKRFYPFTHEPVYVTKDTLFYQNFDGISVSNLRYQYEKQWAKNGIEKKEIRKKLMITEMIVLPSILSAYKKSLCVGNSGQTAPINRFFIERLKGSKRIKGFYSNGLTLPMECGGGHLSIEELLSYTILINGRNFGTLKEIEKKAIKILSPNNFVGNWEICGLGDGHIGNILLSKKKNRRQEYDVLMVDYEIAGYHSPFLDLVKPYYVDLFFSIFYADILSPDSLLQRGIISKLSINNNCISIDIDTNYGLSPHALFLRKMRCKGLIFPFFKFLSLRLKNKHMMKRQMNIFRAGLFTNAIYTRNFSDRPDVFFANLAIGILLFLGEE